MLSLEDRDLIKAYRAAGWTIQDIHEHTGFGRNTIKRVLDAKPPKFKPQSKAKTDAKTPGYRGKTVRVYRCKDGIREPVKITAAIYDPADDPTQSFVATT